MPADSRYPAIFLMGPTASGKTALACMLSERFPVALVSVDSAQVYRGMDIGTAKPDPATLRRHPHALIDIRDPAEPYSAADFRIDALKTMEGIAARGQVPLLVGGTGLYFRALHQGLAPLPEADLALRARLAKQAKTLGWPALHQRLREADPAAAARIAPHDAQRIQRALEVIELTNRPLSKQQNHHAERFPWRVLKLALLPVDRARLHARIARRFEAMLQQGLLDEVRRLHGRGDLSSDLPSMRAVGYRQAWEHLDGAIDAAQLRNRGIFATRQLAKRQMTWLRGELDARAFDPDQTFLTARIIEAIELFLGPCD